MDLFFFLFRYLTDDQLRGPSKVEAYITALSNGCRCVECKLKLDCRGPMYLIFGGVVLVKVLQEREKKHEKHWNSSFILCFFQHVI